MTAKEQQAFTCFQSRCPRLRVPPTRRGRRSKPASMMTSNVKSVTKVAINAIKFPLRLRVPQNFITGTQVVAERI
jgi:hypothetical protein